VDPSLPLALLYREAWSPAAVRRDLAHVTGWARAVAPAAASVDAPLVLAAHAAGLTVQAYTVNREAEMDRLLALGVDGLITDVPGPRPGARRPHPGARAGGVARYRAAPCTGAGVFLSWRGRWSDSPRAISAELARRRPAVRQVWVLDDEAAGELPAGHGARGSRHPGGARRRSRARAGSISNDTLHHGLGKRPDCFYLQTWHGTPRNDVLHGPERAACRPVRRELDLPAGTRAASDDLAHHRDTIRES
jgi:hypothetical protein